jgi:hypothetical protein
MSWMYRGWDGMSKESARCVCSACYAWDFRIRNRNSKSRRTINIFVFHVKNDLRIDVE